MTAETKLKKVAAKKERRPPWAVPLADVELAPPIPDPQKIICIGQNYIDHCREQGVDPPKSPIFFTKFPTTLTGPSSPVKLPPDRVTSQVDYEVELAFVIGAMVSATDPAAVLATFRRLGAPHRLANLVEGESLFNDGTGLVIFVLAIQAVQSDITISGAVVQFFATVAISILIGVGGGLLVSWVVSRVDDHLIETTASLALAYGTYVVADAFHQSGIIATVTAGIVLGNVGRRFGMSEKTREAIDTIWEFLAFLLTAVVFLLVGLAITIEDLLGAVGPIFWGILAVLVGRALVVYLLLNGASRLAVFGGVGSRLPLSWLNVLWWSGLRGAVAVAMALSIPEDFPQRALLQEVTFGVVLFTLLIQGTTIELLIARAEKIDV